MSAIFELLFLAIVCGVVFYRLFTVLGTRVGTERDRSSSFDQQKKAATAKESSEQSQEEVLEADYTPTREARTVPSSADFTQEISQIRTIDPSFSLEGFTQGAEKAFRLILEAFAAGDKETLKGLLSREVYASFVNVMAQRPQDHAMTTEITGLEGEVTRIQLAPKGKTLEATITVSFESRQRHTLTLAEGVRSEEQACTDIWTFRRTLGTQDPTWILIKTQDPDEPV